MFVCISFTFHKFYNVNYYHYLLYLNPNLKMNLRHIALLGEVNPLLEKSYMDLTLHQRVWILKCLCDNSLVRQNQVFCEQDTCIVF